MEPPHLCTNMRAMAKYLKDTEEIRIEACEVSVIEELPIIGLQGEVISLFPE
jgi:hypothetical protein